jgi:hypothetical protein
MKDLPPAPRRYYSLRTGCNAGAITLDLPTLKKLWNGRVNVFFRKEYFQGAFGKDCVDDAGAPGEIGDDIEGHILLKIRKTNLWPIHQHLDRYTEDDLFDMTEFLFDCVSKPSGGHHHSFSGCGWHYAEFDKSTGRREFCAAMNEIFRDYGSGYELSDDGEVISAVDLGEQFVSTRPTRRKLTFSPNVFHLPEEAAVESDLVAVMMPFDAAFAPTHAAIKAACDRSSLRCVRVDDIWEESVLVQDIFNLVCRAHIVVVDFSTKNGNVMYETGIAHTLGKHVVPIAQARTDIPFDLQHHRYLSYLPNKEGLEKLTVELAARLKQLRVHVPIVEPPSSPVPPEFGGDDDIPF